MGNRRKKRRPEELKKAPEAVSYEMDMLTTTSNKLAFAGQTDEVVYYALVESFVLHARVLIDFLYPDNPKNDHIIAGDFFSSVAEWEKKRPDIPEILKETRVRAHKQAAHLSYDRLSKYTGPEKVWAHIEIANEIIKVFNVFVKSEPNNYFELYKEILSKSKSIKDSEGSDVVASGDFTRPGTSVVSG